MLYKILILPHFDYCDVIYDCLTQKDENRLQTIHDACIKGTQVPKRTQTTEIYKTSKLQMLSKQRWVHTATEMYKVAHNCQPDNILAMFNLSSEISGRTTRRAEANSFYPPMAELEMTKKGIRHGSVKVWEMVPNELKIATSLNSFKTNICQI